jgi:tetratricopeptide (TPR) repeat protein
MNESELRRVPRRTANTLADRQTALWRGLPAALLAVLGLGAIVFATDQSSRLEQRYRRWAEDASKERTNLSEKLVNELRLLQAGSSGKSVDELIPPDDKRRKRLEEVWTSERLYYEKLIALNANEPDYRYHYALACVNGDSPSEFQRGYTLLESLAPHNQPGYYKAHLWWIDHFTQLVQLRKINTQMGAELIYSHAESCLKRQADEKTALMRKGDAALMLGRNMDALDAYSILFASDPFYFGNLVTVNTRLNRTEANAEVFRSAKARIESRLGDKMSADKWGRHWEGLLTCMIGLSDHEGAAERLRQEIERQKNETNSVNQLFLEQLLAKVLVGIQRKSNPVSTPTPVFTEKDVELISEAYRLDSKNLDVLQILTRIGMSDSPVAESARKIYDPDQDPSPSALVLNEMGAVALSKKDYTRAINCLERARSNDPRNMTTLNNLAYVYLVSENRNPERALKLVDEAIRLIPGPEEAKNVMTYFLDTRAAALMQMNRMPEAIAAFELALKDRPDNVKIIESLIKCYEASNLSADAYKERLKKLTEK